MSSTIRPNGPVSCRRINEDEYEIALFDANGTQHTMKIPAPVWRLVIAAMIELDGEHDREDNHATKLPKDFSIGTGRFEEMVLLRFENETPYAFDSELAASLGNALLTQVSELMGSPARQVH